MTNDHFLKVEKLKVEKLKVEKLKVESCGHQTFE